MKKFALFLAPLMAITFLTNCGGPTQHVVTFESNGGTHVNTQKVKDKETATEPNPAPEKTDYTFGGWFTNSDLTGNAYNFSTPVTSDITLFAKWTGGPSPVIPTYTIDFQGEYCSSSLDPAAKYHTGDSVNFDINFDNTKYKLPDKINISGVKSYVYYNLEGKISFTIESNNVLVVVNAEKILPEVTHTVTFVMNGATSSPINPIVVSDGGKIPEDKIPANPTKLGHTFKGWSTSEKEEKIVDLKDVYFTKDTNLYAWWESVNYTVVFNANGGTYTETSSETVTRENVPYNTMPIIPDAPIKIDSTGIKEYTFIGYDKNVVPVTGDATTITYIAQWKETTNVYTINVSSTDDGKFPDSTTTKNITVAAGSNILNSLVNLAKPIHKDPDSLKIFDKYVYENGTEIDPLDIVNKDNIKVKATYRTLTKKTVEECSWDEIATISNQGKDFAEAYFGSITSSNPFTKNIIVNGQIHKVRIIGYGQDVDKDGNKVSITFEFANLISDANGYSLATYWENTNVTDGSNSDYLNSSIRKALTGEGNGELNWFQKDSLEFSTTYANKTVLDMLPTELKSVLKTVKKTVNIKTNNTWTPTEFTDKLFLLNPIELGSQREECEKSETYCFYENCTNETHIRQQVKGADGARNRPIESSNLAGKYTDTKRSYAGYHDDAGGQYWLRSPYTDKTNHGWMVYEGGSIDGLTFVGDYYVYCIARPVCPAFCI